jgi:hypothetical protein
MNDSDFVCLLLFWQQDERENCNRNLKEYGPWINFGFSCFMKFIKRKM